MKNKNYKNNNKENFIYKDLYKYKKTDPVESKMLMNQILNILTITSKTAIKHKNSNEYENSVNYEIDVPIYDDTN